MPHVNDSPIDDPRALHRWAALDRERVRGLGFRAQCVIWQIVRCAACLHRDERMEPWDPLPNLLDMEPLVEKLVRRTDLRTGHRCVKCNAPHVFYDGESHVVFAHAAHQDLHIALEVAMRMTSDGVATTSTSTWRITSEGLTPLSNPAAVLPHLYAEERARHLCALYPLLTLAEVRGMEDLDAYTRAIALREYGRRWEEQGEYAAAWDCLDAALRFDEQHLPTLVSSARILERAHEYPEASLRLHQAWNLHASHELLEPLIRTAWRARQPALLQGACAALLEHDSEALVAYIGLVCAQSCQKITPLRTALADLAEVARRGGQGSTAAVAETIYSRLLPSTPDWSPDRTRQSYQRALVRAWENDGYTVLAAPARFEVDGLHFDADLLLQTDDERRVLVWLVDALPDTHTVRGLWGCLRKLFSSAQHDHIEPLILSPHPLPWRLLRACAAAPDARIEMLLDADHTMQVARENVETFQEFALQAFGTELDFSDEAVDEVDRMIERWRDYGFGEISHTLACLVASFLGEWIRRRVGGRWAEVPEGPDALAWTLNSGTVVYLIAHVKQSVALDEPEPMRTFVGRILENEPVT